MQLIKIIVSSSILYEICYSYNGCKNIKINFYLTYFQMICNSVISTEAILVPLTRLAKVVDKGMELLLAPRSESRYCLLANLFTCRGEPGKV